MTSSRPRCRCSPSSHPAAFRPNVVGSACCSHVRATIGVSASRSARSARAAHSASSSGRSQARKARSCSTSPVSITSWVVPPQWTQRAASGSRAWTSAVRLLTIGTVGMPASAAAAPTLRRSKSSARQCFAITTAAASGITPTRASARASAASKSSIPCNLATSPSIAATSALVSGAPSRAPEPLKASVMA